MKTPMDHYDSISQKVDQWECTIKSSLMRSPTRNTRPRKTLGFKTPAEVFNDVLHWPLECAPIKKGRSTQTHGAKGGGHAQHFQKMRLQSYWLLWMGGAKKVDWRQSKRYAPPLRDYVEVLLYTGMRHGTEASGICWTHIEWHAQDGKRYLRIWVDGNTGGR